MIIDDNNMKIVFIHYFSEPPYCNNLWTDGYRKEDFAEEFYWEHSDERISKFLMWWGPPNNEVDRNWIDLHRDDNTETTWGLHLEQSHRERCPLCEIDLPLN